MEQLWSNVLDCSVIKRCSIGILNLMIFGRGSSSLSKAIGSEKDPDFKAKFKPVFTAFQPQEMTVIFAGILDKVADLFSSAGNCSLETQFGVDFDALLSLVEVVASSQTSFPIDRLVLESGRLLTLGVLIARRLMDPPRYSIWFAQAFSLIDSRRFELAVADLTAMVPYETSAKFLR